MIVKTKYVSIRSTPVDLTKVFLKRIPSEATITTYLKTALQSIFTTPFSRCVIIAALQPFQSRARNHTTCSDNTNTVKDNSQIMIRYKKYA